jgi:2',3'-cyclic-nucleotide 3'-phosphodiesterase/NEDD4-binding protein 2
MECQQKFLRLLDDHEESLIIVANTSTKDSDFNFYIEEAKKRNIVVFSLVLENRHGNKNIHNVPEHVLERQKENIKNSLKL